MTPTHPKRAVRYIAPSPETVLAPLIAELLGLNRTAAPTVIELCSRDLRQLDELSRYNPQGCYIGIDRTPASMRSSLDDGDEAADRPLTYHGVDATHFHPVCCDVFTYVSQPRHEHDPESARVYCRPPINGPMSKFDYRATADRMLASLAASSPEYHALAAHTPTAPEWYYLYAALCACGPRGRAVVRVPSRLLNLARMKSDRKLLLGLHLIERVILLPKLPFAAAQAPMDSALIVLSHNNSHVSFLDGSHLTDTSAGGPQCNNRPVSANANGLLDRPFDGFAFDTLLDAVVAERDNSTSLDTPWALQRTTEQLAADTWSLMPFSYVSRAFSRENYEELGNHFTVQRGTPRKTLETLASTTGNIDPQLYTPHDHYYLSLKPFVDGQSMPVEHVAKIVGQPDVYDLGEHDSGELKSLKVLSDDETHLLLARTGIPFKIALVMPCEEPSFDPSDPEAVQPVWRDVCSAVLADSAFSLTPKHDGACLPEFLLAFLSTDEGQALLRTSAHGASIPQLSSGDVRRMRIPVPNRAEQQRFIARYRSKQQAYEASLNESQRLQSLKRTLL